MNTTTYDQLFAFFGLQQNPFGVSPDVRFFFSTPAHESTLAELLFAIQTRQGLVLLTGESGAGKTTLLQHLLESLQRRRVSSSYIFHSRLEADELFRFILQDFGVQCASHRKGEVIQTLYEWLVCRHSAGDTPVIIIDEAHVLPPETIDELRLLLNLECAGGKLVQIILAGQPELDEKLRSPELRQLRQRVMFRCRIPLLTREETSGYIRSRLSGAGLENPELFPAQAVDAIFEYSKGIPRTINLLGEHSLINAYAEHQQSVTPELIRYIAADFDLIDNPLSVNKDAGPARRVTRFPVLNPESRSLSGLRMAYLSDLPLPERKLAPAVEPPGLVLEQLLSYAESSGKPVKPTPAQPAPPRIVPDPSALAAARVEGRVSTPSFAPFSRTNEGATALAVAPVGRQHIRVWRRHSAKRSFVRYWREIRNSFRRDARIFYADWAWVFGGVRGKPTGHIPKPQSRHF